MQHRTPRFVAALAAAALLSLTLGDARAQDTAPPSPAGTAAHGDTPRGAYATDDLALGDLAAEKAARRTAAAAAAGEDAELLVLSPPQVDGVPGSNRNPDFEYLCPASARQAALLVAAPRRATPESEDARSTYGPATDRLYLPLRNPPMERWTGVEAGPDAETAAANRFADARAIEALAADIAAALDGRTTLYLSPGPAAAGDALLTRLLAEVQGVLPGRTLRVADLAGPGRTEFVAGLEQALAERRSGAGTDGAAAPGAGSATLPVDVRSARTLLTTLREVKSPTEVDSIRRATEATVLGHLDAMRAARPGVFEYQLAARVEFRCRDAGCARMAYPSIVGSGPNSCVLHYDRNRRQLADGDLVVIDAGGEMDGYATDVTRTFPVSGHFSEEQAQVYDAVLEAQEAAIAVVRPGVTLRQVHEVARAVLARHGLDKWFIHGTCHAVGLEVHDAWRRDAVLRPGCVITVEPGVYDAARSLGVRIEDTVLVTESGCEVLSSALPKRRADVERAMVPAGK